jgi:hypothetical protein
MSKARSQQHTRYPRYRETGRSDPGWVLGGGRDDHPFGLGCLDELKVHPELIGRLLGEVAVKASRARSNPTAKNRAVHDVLPDCSVDFWSSER